MHTSLSGTLLVGRSLVPNIPHFKEDVASVGVDLSALGTINRPLHAIHAPTPVLSVRMVHLLVALHVSSNSLVLSPPLWLRSVYHQGTRLEQRWAYLCK